MTVDPKRLAVGQLAQDLASGYYAFLVGHYVAVNPEAIRLLRPAKVPGQPQTGEIKRKDGTFHTFDLRHYLDLLREDESIQGRFLRAWAMGALLTLGDELSKPEHDYFGHPPILELVYHLRNGMAHGNRFNITNKDRLRKCPAHNRNAVVKSPLGTLYEITLALDGQPVLFDFIGAADVIDLLQSVVVHLSR